MASGPAWSGQGAGSTPGLLDDLGTWLSSGKGAAEKRRQAAEAAAQTGQGPKTLADLTAEPSPALGSLPTIGASTAATPATSNFVEQERTGNQGRDFFRDKPQEYNLPGSMIGRALDAPQSPADAPKQARPISSPIRAYKDSEGRTIFSNIGPSEQPKLKEVSYAGETAKLRPAGRQAGGVSSPVARDDQGRTTMISDPEIQFQRQRELEDLGHAAIVQQLQDQANPQALVQRDLSTAKMIADQFTPSSAEVAAHVDALTKTVLAAKPGLDPKVARALAEEQVTSGVEAQKRRLLEEHLNKLHYPGATLSGYGAQLRGDAANFGQP